MSMKNDAKILLQLNWSQMYSRSILKGIIRYAKTIANWTFYHEIPFFLRNDSRLRIREIQEWNPDGMIILEARNVERLLALGIHTIICPDTIVSLNLRKQMLKHPGIISDSREVGKMGASYFLAKGYKNFAFVGYKKAQWSLVCEQSFCESLDKTGHKIFTFSTPSNWSNRKEKEYLSNWLKELPKPIAIMACNDDRGLDVLQACKAIHVHVPEEVAVLGVDDDEIVCEMANPTLSSIMMNAEKAGYDTAKLLHQMISGEAPKSPQNILVSPQHIRNRQSTDITAIEDTEVAQALNFIRNNVRQNLQVGTVVANACLSRRNLELRFRKAIGRSVHYEIRRTRIEAISHVLLETNLPVSQIAAEFGYNDAVNIARFFRKETGMSLHEYRKKHKPG